MADSKDDSKKKPDLPGKKKWITVRGKHIQIDPSKNVKEQIRDEVGEDYEDKPSVSKTLFKMRDKVHFDGFTKTGIIYGVEPKVVKILCGDQRFVKHVSSVHKDSECFGPDHIHWDYLTKLARIAVLKENRIPDMYASRDWAYVPDKIQEVIKQGASGYNDPISTETVGTYNPVYQETTINDIIERARREKTE